MTEDTVIVLCADTHCGSALGLMTPEAFQLHDGGEYHPSPLQRMIWDVWAEGWARVAQLRKGKRMIIVHDGDAVEGVHHQTTQIISGRVEEHEEAHIACMDWAMQKSGFDAKKDKLFYISGTEEHAGNGSRSEERIASDLDGVVPFNDNRKTWDQLLAEVNGKVLDISHHGGNAGTTILTDASPLHRRLGIVYTDCLESDMPIPRVWARAHIHRFYHATWEGAKGVVDGFTLPAFQAKTGYVYKVSNNRKKPSDIGLVILTILKDGSFSYEAVVKPIVQDKVQKV